jgi:hypothetical protein
VWFGLTVPGKKMIGMLGATGIEAGRSLIDVYQAAPQKALLYAAIALHLLPERGVYGPALRDLTKAVAPRTLFGAALTDIRDFLKLRFRAEGMKPEQVGSSLTTGRFPPGVEPRDAALVVQYVIAALDALANDPEGTIDLAEACGNLKQLLRESAKELARLQYDPGRALISRETYEESVLEQNYGSHIFDIFDESETER